MISIIMANTKYTIIDLAERKNSNKKSYRNKIEVNKSGRLGIAITDQTLFYVSI